MARMSSYLTQNYSSKHCGFKMFAFISNRKIVWGMLFSIFSLLYAGENWLESEAYGNSANIFVEVWSGKEKCDVSGYTQFFIEIAPTDLVFTLGRQGYFSAYTFNVVILNKNREVVQEKIFQDTIRVRSYAETVQYGWNRLFSMRFMLPDGEYFAFLNLVDNHSGREMSKSVRFEVHNSNSFALDVSDVLLARRDEVETNNQETVSSVLPFPPKIYGADQHELYCYFEIYNRDVQPGDSIYYTISYIDPLNRQKIVTEKCIWYNTQKIPVMYSFNTAELAPGTYKLLVQIHNKDNNFQLEREKIFLVYQSPIDLRFKLFSDMLEELRLISTKEELEALKTVPESQRQVAVNNFWKKRDPSPGTPRNELLTEFYRRLNFARQNFWQVCRNGGKLTDQGKVYVIMGAPDRIVRQMTESFNGQMEIWFYQQQKLQVVFRDDCGFGDYRLIAPYSLLSDL